MAALFGVVILFSHATTAAADLESDGKAAEQLQAIDTIVSVVNSPGGSAPPEEHISRGDRLNRAFVALTGQAINPLFGVTVLGMYNYFRTDAAYREQLPLLDSPYIWLPCLIIILLMLFNSTICEAIPILKVPLNALGDFVNKVGAIALLPLLVSLFAENVAQPLAEEISWLNAALSQTAYAGEFVFAQAAWHTAGWVVGAIAGTIIYLTVWLTFNVIDVIILICPFPGVDAVLKASRLAVIGLLTGLYQLSPTLALILACILVLVSLFVAGWSFRLSVFGLVFSTDIIFFKKRRVHNADARAFSTTALCKTKRIPMRTIGRVSTNAADELVFSYRPWLVLGTKHVILGPAANFSCGKGFVGPIIFNAEFTREFWLRLPPRYRRQESDIVKTFGLRREEERTESTTLRGWFSSEHCAASDASGGVDPLAANRS